MLTTARQELLENLAKLISDYESTTLSNNDVSCELKFFGEVEAYGYNGEKFLETK